MAFFHCIVIAQGLPLNMVNDFLPKPSESDEQNTTDTRGTIFVFVAKTS